MKKFFILSVLILSVCSVFASENTLVPKAQLPEIKSAVFANALRTVKKCNKPVINEINVVSVLSSLKKNNEGKAIFGEWVEEWTVDACGTEVSVLLNMSVCLRIHNLLCYIYHQQLFYLFHQIIGYL